MHRYVRLAAATIVFASTGAFADANYEDLTEYFSAAGDDSFDRWIAARDQLAADFDQVCGDTFCEGDYSDLRPLSLYCATASDTGLLRSCTWVFGGSFAQVQPQTGGLTVHRRTFACALPLGPGATASQLLDVLTSKTDPAAPIDRPLPGTSHSIYDALVGCL